MPIFITNYEWTQKEHSLTLEIGLRKADTKNVNITITSSYVKINFTPFIFEAFLANKIDPQSASNIVKNGILYLTLQKKVKENWTQFALILTKEESENLRNIALKEFEDLQKNELEHKLENKRELSRIAVCRQIERNEEKHHLQTQFLVEQTKQFFREDSEPSLERTFREYARCSSTCSEGSGNASEGDYDGDEESIHYSSVKNISSKSKLNTCSTLKEKQRQAPEVPIRQHTVLKIRHTPHKVGLPKRKSTSPKQIETGEKEENIDTTPEAKVTESLEDIRIEAKTRYTNGDYEEASNLYSKAIVLNPEEVSSYSNRAACYLALNLNDKAVRDCTKALSLLSSLPESKSRLLCLIRRGTAYVRLNNYQKGLDDYKEALELDPKNALIAKDVIAISSYLNASSDTEDDEVLGSSHDEGKSA